MWQIFENLSFDLREVSFVQLLVENGTEKVVITMKNNQQINANLMDDVTPALAYESLTNLIKAMHESDKRLKTNTFEVLKRIRSELNLISQNLRRLS